MHRELFSNPSLLQLYLEDDEKILFNAVCRRNTESMSAVIRSAIRDYLKNNRHLIRPVDKDYLRLRTDYIDRYF